MKKMVWDRSEIKTFEKVFDREDFMKMTDHMRYPNWSYGNISNPNAPSTPFFHNDLMAVSYTHLTLPTSDLV